MGDEILKEMKKLIQIWREFTSLQTNFKLNPDIKKVEKLANGVLENEKNHGLKYCPCRLTTQNRTLDSKLICPCNFFIQKTWREKGECWCGLFVKK